MDQSLVQINFWEQILIYTDLNNRCQFRCPFSFLLLTEEAERHQATLALCSISYSPDSPTIGAIK